MKTLITDIANSVSHLLFPHNCLGCSTDILNADDLLCAKCFSDLPETNFAASANNPIERIFFGRLNIEQATASYYFTKDSLLQHLLKQLKYKSNQEIGLYLGKLLGHHLKTSGRFNSVDVLVPLPLNKKKQYKRGYNQAEIICKGIITEFNRPIINHVSVRSVFTESQTTENRISRWQNMEGVFDVTNESEIEGKHILLVDDVITTGATLESCGSKILNVKNTKLSIACVAFTI